MSALKPGDSVVVGSLGVTGTVVKVDHIPERPGVLVRLHRPVRGSETCFATHGECTKVVRTGGDS